METKQMPNEGNDAKFFKASYAFKQRMGHVKIDQSVIDKCQKVIDNNLEDFEPLAREFLDRLKAAIDGAHQDDLPMSKRLSDVTEPIMELKANAKMFKYDLVSDLASIMLSFVEGLKVVDADAVAILEAHHRTLSVIVIKKMQGTGGQVGVTMMQELQGVCQRYFSKK